MKSLVFHPEYETKDVAMQRKLKKSLSSLEKLVKDKMSREKGEGEPASVKEDYCSAIAA